MGLHRQQSAQEPQLRVPLAAVAGGLDRETAEALARQKSEETGEVHLAIPKQGAWSVVKPPKMGTEPEGSHAESRPQPERPPEPEPPPSHGRRGF